MKKIKLTLKQREKLLCATIDNTDDYKLANYKTWCKVLDVHDGDTIIVGMYIDGKIKKINCRLSGIDCAELISTNDKEVKFAEKTRDKMKEIMMDDNVKWIHVIKTDKYGGRFVCNIYPNECDDFCESYNNYLLTNGYAYAYDGKTKKKRFEDWYVEK
jgi:endonuclease YncB( thermonuclease family)